MSGEVISYNVEKFGGTETVARYIEDNILNDTKNLKNVNWIVIPGRVDKYLEKIKPGFNIVWCHLPSSEILKDHIEIKKFFINKNIVDMINIYLVQSKWHKNDLHTKFGIPLEKIYVINNGLIMQEFPTENIYEKHKSKNLKILFMSQKTRGLDILLKSLKYVKDKNIEVISNSCNCSNCSSLITDKRVTFTNHLNRKEYTDLLLSSNILAYPCIWDETFCIVASESMAAGLKIITTNAGALPETTAGYATIVNIPLNKMNKIKEKKLIKSFGKTLNKEIKKYRRGFDPAEQIEYSLNNYSWHMIFYKWRSFDKHVGNLIQNLNKG